MLTSKAVAKDLRIWRHMDKRIYDVILASPEVLLGPRSLFWQHTVRNKRNKFKHCLAHIAIDEVHMIWGWQDSQ